ncbi:MAG: PIN domain-containing protein [Clostridiales bacterium]|nr:PIN domain-containing protein [Clostridiales bacterium]
MVYKSDNPEHLGILIALYCGLRIGEVYALQWGDLNLEDDPDGCYAGGSPGRTAGSYMKALIDTCVVIDFLQRREPFDKDAVQIMRLAAMNQFTGCITAKSATDIYYLNHRATHSDKESRTKLNQLLAIIGLLDTSAEDIFHAISSDTSDFEDAVMIETARRSGIDCIVTRNQKDYEKSPVTVYSPAEFLRILEDDAI